MTQRLSRTNRIWGERRNRPVIITPEPEQRGPALILDAIEVVERGEGISDQWADVCLRLADAQDYPSGELRPGWNVDVGVRRRHSEGLVASSL